MRPDPTQALSGLKDFQVATVEHAFRRLWIDDDQVKRFLVADEVGLGKTMVAKGVIAKTIDHLWETDKRIDVVYICSNAQIARQNLNRLNVVGGTEHRHADRLTLLPTVIRDLREQRINFVSFTPGTSFQVGSTGGKYQERVLLYWMLALAWGEYITRSVRWIKFFQGTMNRDNFRYYVQRFDPESLDAELCASFGEAIGDATGPEGSLLTDELDACAQQFTYLRGNPGRELDSRRTRLIGQLRRLVARAAVKHLEPDLVILDEFQRFKDLIDPESQDEGAKLAQEIFDHEDAKVLMLSATPYKMYTLPDEPDGDDHYTDFIRTVRGLAGAERAHLVETELRTLRECLLADGDIGRARQARDIVEQELRRVISRTERLASTPDRNGMLAEKKLDGVELAEDDLRAWRTFDEVSKLVDGNDVLEYWRSTPYPLNLMERNSYQVRAKVQAALEANDPSVARIIAGSRDLLRWTDVQRYRHVDPGNAKLRGLSKDVLDDREAWRLVWLPPSLPYYELSGAYAQPQLRSFTKRLLFSAWAVVPKAVAAMLSYDAERRAVRAAGRARRPYDARPTSPPLQFRVAGGQAANMPTFAILYPALTLARLGDPLEVARSLGAQLPLSQEELFRVVRSRVEERLLRLPDGAAVGGQGDQRWYWAAPFLLDQERDGTSLAELMRDWGSQDEDQESRLANHVSTALEVSPDQLGPRPNDLAEMMALMAIAAPGVTALRSLSRVCGGESALDDPVVRKAAFVIASGLRSTFNKPEIVALVRASDDSPYWRAVLDHALAGGLQPVLDEYAHVLVESEGLQNAPSHERAVRIAETMSEAMSTRAAQNVVEQIRVIKGDIRLDDHRINSHFAARFGRAQSDDQAAMRESTIRSAYNSPFRPFVLASTSVGQEGLDFHTYSHAVVHWNLPSNPVDLEQREGRVHRYKGHAVRKNVAKVHGAAALRDVPDPWSAIFEAAVADRDPGEIDLTPFWIFPVDDGAAIERYVPALPLSREISRYKRLQRTVGAYRLVIGQPRQDDLVRYLGEAEGDLSWMRIDLSPPTPPH